MTTFSKRERERVRRMKIDGDSKKTNGWKSFKKMKDYLRSEFEMRAPLWFRNREGTYLHIAAYVGDVERPRKC